MIAKSLRWTISRERLVPGGEDFAKKGLRKVAYIVEGVFNLVDLKTPLTTENPANRSLSPHYGT